jgi:RNA polymerase sigma factor (sigma-70 family)
MQQRTDAEWLADLLSSDPRRRDPTIQELYDFLVYKVYGYLYRHAAGIPQIAVDFQAHAEDVAQDALWKIYQAVRRGEYDPARAPFLGWAYIIAHRAAISLLRRHLVPVPPRPPNDALPPESRSTHRPRIILPLDDLLEEDALPGAVGEADPARVAARDFVRRVVAEDLTDLQRTVCILYYCYGYRVREIAVLLGKSEKAVENVLYQVRMKFRQRAQIET